MDFCLSGGLGGGNGHQAKNRGSDVNAKIQRGRTSVLSRIREPEIRLQLCYAGGEMEEGYDEGFMTKTLRISKYY